MMQVHQLGIKIMSENQTQEASFERALGRLEGKMDAMVSSVNALASSFESLEKGRLSRLEIKVAEIVTETGSKSRNVALWVSSIVVIVGGIVSNIVAYYLIR